MQEALGIGGAQSIRPVLPRLAYIIFFLSGIAGLGYEVVWTRMFAIGLGHEMPSLLAVVAAFFGGLAVGAFALDARISRSRRPGRWYVLLEVVIGVWALVTIAAIPWLNRFAAGAIGLDPSPFRQAFWSFAIPFAGLLPATVAMGATLPAMERLVARLRGSGAGVAGLYAVNTAGAVAGTLLATFVLVPAFGFRVAIAAIAAVNFLCAAATAFGPAAGEAERPRVTHAFDDPPSRPRLAATIFTTGLLGIGYEVLCVRVMAQVLENTVFSFASALSVYLFGTAAGAALYQRFAAKRTFAGPLTWLLQLQTLTCLVGIVVLPASEEVYERARLALGGGPLGSVAAEMTLALLVFLAPTLVMGATFSHLVQAARRETHGIGRALGLNTLGASFASVIFGITLLPLVGARWTLLAIAAGYLPLVPPSAVRPHRLVPSLASILVVAVLPTSLILVQGEPGSRLVAYRDGVMAAVAVLEGPDGGRVLKVNNRFSMGSTARSFADRRQAHIPLLLHPAPRSVLFLGVGTGITAGAATMHAGVAVTAVELVPEVVDLLDYFGAANRIEALRAGRVVAADARRYVRASEETFDVVIADLFHPARDGAGALFTREHFAAVRERVAPGGLFCQWLPLYQLDLDTLRMITRTFVAVFPSVTGYIAHFNTGTPMLGLVGRAAPAAYADGWFETRVGADPALAAELETVAISGDLTLFGCFIAGDAQLRAFAGAGPLNTDDHPRVMFRAPRLAYTKRESAYGRLRTLLVECRASADGVLGADAAPALRARLDRYLDARDRFLEGAMRMQDGRDAEAIALYLESVRASADFRTAYVVCLRAALDRRKSDRAYAREILESLIEANPEDPRAAHHLRNLGR